MAQVGCPHSTQSGNGAAWCPLALGCCNVATPGGHTWHLPCGCTLVPRGDAPPPPVTAGMHFLISVYPGSVATITPSNPSASAENKDNKDPSAENKDNKDPSAEKSAENKDPSAGKSAENKDPSAGKSAENKDPSAGKSAEKDQEPEGGASEIPKEDDEGDDFLKMFSVEDLIPEKDRLPNSLDLNPDEFGRLNESEFHRLIEPEFPGLPHQPAGSGLNFLAFANNEEFPGLPLLPQPHQPAAACKLHKICAITCAGRRLKTQEVTALGNTAGARKEYEAAGGAAADQEVVYGVLLETIESVKPSIGLKTKLANLHEAYMAYGRLG